MTSPFLPIRRHITSPDRAGIAGVLPVFPGRKFTSSKGPVWSTEVFKSRSGRRWTSRNYTYPIWAFELQYAWLRRRTDRNEVEQLTAFFNAMSGQFDEFLYLDPDENSVVDQVVGVGNGVIREFQLTRSLVDWIEPVRALNGEPAIAVGGVQTSALETLANGRIRFDVAPPAGAVVSWTGSYFFRCAFSQDDLALSQLFKSFWELGSLKFESVKS